uniref:TrpE protein n=1 Tax=Fopius arisanus TaxID=64838 RepID=A0A0C9QZN4_9HYME
MWYILTFLLFLSGHTLGRHHHLGEIHEKTRFDRSMSRDDNLLNLGIEAFVDEESKYEAFKARNSESKICFLRKSDGTGEEWHFVTNNHGRIIFPSGVDLTKIEAWKLAGDKIVEFCDGKLIQILEDDRPAQSNIEDPFFNEIPFNENDIVQKPIGDIVLETSKKREKREVTLEHVKKPNVELVRKRREGRARFRGQTQSQYLNIGDDAGKEGKAEAEATDQTSRAVVSEC